MKYSKKCFALSFLLIVLLFNAACADSPAAVADDADFPVVPASKNVPKFRVETVAANLEIVWSIVFAADGRMFFTERPGRVRVVENGKLRAAPFFTVPDVELSGESGLMGMTLHPNFAENHFVYLAYAYQDASKNQTVRVARYRETGETLTDAKTIIEAIPASRYHSGTRLKFGADGKLYITTGDATKQTLAQKLDSINGKTLRLNDDGTIPNDNPFANQKGARPEIWTYGHRNAQGMDFHPETGLMFQTEHGPSVIDGVSLFKRTGGDEVNIVERGKNYGWAKISHNTKREGMETPIIDYSPAVAPASGMFYRGNLFPEFKNNFFFGALKGEAIIRLVLDGRRIVSQDKLLEKQYGRIREIAEAADGSIYFSTSNRDGRGDPTKEDDRILRIVPNTLK
ncbi:MAG TPA: PQQ-dependent sugar dehydrogenase [Pyrinomonadaceae bacterium]|jgi:glucose/arabinose dehydrogenase|nr:PQQ-dependent sugar dehydrogenase [Pyrinomonadaceae bacterium]